MRFFAFFAIVALAEMATFFWVESRIGLLWALGLAVLTAVIGSLLVRRAGVSVLGRIRSRVEEGRLPGRELSDGAAILVAGAFLISPGFITDIAGFLLLVPAVQAMIHRIITKRFSARIGVFMPDRQPLGEQRPMDDLPSDVIDVDGWE